MCGIAGMIGAGGGADDLEPALRGMMQAVAHRGPDASGVWFDRDRGVALGHHRLSILDLSENGAQPMLSPGGRFVVSYNGEIYNCREIAAELEEHGVRFRGHSDTEVLAAGAETWGLEKTLEKLTGMFAFALWDRKENRLHLVRDRLGIKPLYTARAGKAFLFASELSGILAHPGFVPEIDREAVTLYLRYGAVPAPLSVFTRCRKLEPGTILTLGPADTSREQTDTYWSAREAARSGTDSPYAGTSEEAVEKLDRLLTDAVRQRLLSDVPLGAFLSGGIDSSAVVALMQKGSSLPVRTFTIGNAHAAHDEAADARRVAEHLGCQHTELYLEDASVLEDVRQLPRVYSEPFGDSSQLPTWLVSRLARTEVTVALSGDGGDELFAGYNRYVWGTRIWNRISRVPLALRRPLSGALAALPASGMDAFLEAVPRTRGIRLPGEKMRKLAVMLRSENAGSLYRDLLYHWNRPQTAVLGGTEPKEPSHHGAGLLEDMMLRDLTGYLPDDILTKVDRASMFFGLEVRVPILDHRVVEFAWTLPREMKLRDGRGKWILRRVLDRYVPSALVDRGKSGFAVPVAAWLRGPLREWADSLIGSEALRAGGVFDPEVVGSRWREHLSGRRDWHDSLWDVLMFQAWMEHWMRGPASEKTAPSLAAGHR